MEEFSLEWLNGIDYRLIAGPAIAPDDPAALYLGPLPKFISCEIIDK
jgi:hypothetical protein